MHSLISNVKKLFLICIIESLHSSTRDNHSLTESIETSECKNYKHVLWSLKCDFQISCSCQGKKGAPVFLSEEETGSKLLFDSHHLCSERQQET